MRVIFETQDALCGMGREIFFGGDKYPKDFMHGKSNPVTGPLWVEGAMPGDTLEVKVHRIDCLKKGFFCLPNSGEAGINTMNGQEYVEFAMSKPGVLTEIATGRRFPANPMIGVIGTASKGEKPWYSTECGDHGGNMDNNAVKAGVTVFLPVFTEGGLLGMGDVHAAMGDGEVFGQGVEIEADIEVTVTLHKDMKIKRPYTRFENVIATMAAGNSLDEAAKLCIEDLKTLLMSIYDLNPLDAAMAMALYGDLKVCQVCNPQKSMRMEIDMEGLAFIE
jgi:amidase